MNNYNNRYGFDLLSVFMIFIALILNIFPVTRIFSFILLILSFYRAFSKKYYKRRQEKIIKTNIERYEYLMQHGCTCVEDRNWLTDYKNSKEFKNYEQNFC